MSIHIGAKPGEIAPVVLLPGDPLRAQHIAEKFLKNVVTFNTIRGMMGYTGHAEGYGNPLVSVQASGMGMPSLGIYVNELFDHYNVETIIRIGTCGALQDYIDLGAIVLAAGACSDSNNNRRRFRGLDFAPLTDWALLHKAYHKCKFMKLTKAYLGNILSTDTFYTPDPEEWRMWANAGVLAVEMEAAELYTLAALKRRKALSVLTVSDNLATGESMPAEQRQTQVWQAVEIALYAAFAST